MTPIRVVSILVGGYLLCTTPKDGFAQGSDRLRALAAEPPPIPVMVQMPELGRARGKTDITITRRAAEGYRIVIPRALATPEALSAALRAAYALLEKDGDLLRDDEEFVVPTYGMPAATEKDSGAERLLNELMKNGARGTGVPTVTIYIPAASSRAASSRDARARARPQR